MCKNNKVNNCDVLFEDFKEVKYLVLEEKLTVDEVEEGLEPESQTFAICITNHAYRRMYGEQERYCDYEWVENLLMDKSTAILNSPSNEDILVLADDKKMALVISISIIQGERAISLISVIRNVIYKNGVEVELENRSNKKGTRVI